MIKKIATFTLVLAVLALGSTAHATPIKGTILFNGLLEAIGPDPTDLDTATGLDFFSGIVSIGSDDYSGVAAGTSVAFTDIASFAGFAGLSPLWTFTVGPTTYSFDLATLVVNQTVANTLSLKGTGIAKITGLDDTPGSFSLTAQEPALPDVALFSFSASSRVPEPATLGLLGLGFLGLGLLRRKAD